MAKNIIAIENARSLEEPEDIKAQISGLDLKINELTAVTQNILGRAYFREKSFEDAIERIYLLSKIKKGIQQADSGLTISHEDVEKKFSKWLT